MNAKSWPRIKAVIKNGKPLVMVDARIAGKGERRFFASKHEAEGWAQVQRVRRKNQGGESFEDRDLASFGWSVKDAIKFALAHLRRQSASVSIESAVDKLLEAKRAAGRTKRYCSEVGMHLGRLARAFEGKRIAEISTADLESFLAGLQLGPGTRNTYRRDIRTLWHFAEKRGWATAASARNTERATAIDKPPGILRPEQIAALLAESRDNDLLAYHAIGCFAGLRASEIKALDWRDIDLAGGFIHVGAKISKTRSRRLVPILDNLQAWLQPIAKPSGPVVERGTRKRHESARKRAGITEWPDNAMRHSFVSYRLAATGNAAQTALESGHDQAVLFQHYRELVKPKDAARYWQIMPSAEAGEKIVALTAA